MLKQQYVRLKVHPYVALAMKPRYAKGVPIDIRIRNKTRKPIEYVPRCGSIVIEDARGRFYETNHLYRVKTVTWDPIKVPPEAEVSVCSWDQKTSYQIGREDFRRRQVPLGKYTFYLEGHVRIGSKRVDVKGHLAHDFEITAGR